MAQYTVATTAGQELAIDFLWDRENRRRTNSGLPNISRNTFVDGVFDQKLKELVVQAKATRMNERINAINTADDTKLAQIDAALGI